VFKDKPGLCTVVQHRIDTGNSPPVFRRPYKLSEVKRKALDAILDDWLKEEIIEPSNSDYCSPILLREKKPDSSYQSKHHTNLDLSDNDETEHQTEAPISWRACGDYRWLNAVTKRDVYPMPRLDDILDRVERTKFMS